MEEFLENLPILLPLIILQLALFAAAWIHIFRHKYYERGSRVIWLLVSCISFIGPIIYFVFGRSDKETAEDDDDTQG